MPWKHYIYKHIRKDTGETFYVGKGTFRKNRKPSFERACAKIHSRNPHWKRIVEKAGYDVEIFVMCKTDKEAQRVEKMLISKIGRYDLKKGPLANFTDGGDGHCGVVVSKELRRKRSTNARKPRSKAWISSIRKARKNGGNGGVVKNGDKLPMLWIKNLSKSKMGEKNPWFGKPSPVSKKVINIKTGIIYPSIARAAKAEGIKAGALYSYLDGSRKNKTDLKKVA